MKPNCSKWWLHLSQVCSLLCTLAGINFEREQHISILSLVPSHNQSCPYQITQKPRYWGCANCPSCHQSVAPFTRIDLFLPCTQPCFSSWIDRGWLLSFLLPVHSNVTQSQLKHGGLLGVCFRELLLVKLILGLALIMREKHAACVCIKPSVKNKDSIVTFKM